MIEPTSRTEPSKSCNNRSLSWEIQQVRSLVCFFFSLFSVSWTTIVDERRLGDTAADSQSAVRRKPRR